MGKIDDIHGDSISRLIQVRGKLKGVHLKWTGDSIQDLDQLFLEYFHRKTLNESLWNGLRELMAMPELKELPERVYGQILSIVLRAQACFELRRAEVLGKQLSLPSPDSTIPGAPA